MKLKDISLEAGVAVSTVSRVLKDPDSSAASPETKEKIFQIALKGGYITEIPRLDPIDQFPPSSLPAKVLYCMLAVDPKEREDNSYFSRLMESIREAAHHYNYMVEYYFPSAESNGAVSLPLDANKTVRGIIVIGRSLPNFVNELKSRFDNILYIGLTALDVPCDQIICPGFDAAKSVVELLHDSGHTRIGFIGSSDDDRIAGYLKAMEERDLPIDRERMVVTRGMSYLCGHDGMAYLLDHTDPEDPLTAVFCGNDNTAIGALQACKERNIQVPEDINLIGMDGSEMGKYMTPSISTVNVPLEEMGRFAVRVLRDRIHGGHSKPIHIHFPFDILERQSGPTLR
ncbi:MAG: LacI family DNA-binding transcriptional regulator [Lachnospiraceae bacterium]|nr:LacI family DNA-binding transcriptional regulator [Lachnospiraceae bacterium]